MLFFVAALLAKERHRVLPVSHADSCDSNLDAAKEEAPLGRAAAKTSRTYDRETFAFVGLGAIPNKAKGKAYIRSPCLR